MRRSHPRHHCSVKQETGARRHLPDVSDPAGELRVAGKTPPPGGRRVCGSARCFVAAPQWRAGELRTRGRALRQAPRGVSSGFINIR